MQSSLRFSRALLLALTGVLASGCTDLESASVSLSAFTQTRSAEVDPVAGMSLVLDASREAAALELEDGTIVDLELGASHLDGSPDACQGDTVDSDRHVMSVLNRPLAVGDRVFHAPVLETGCSLDASSGPVLLREDDAASCDGDTCISFATPEELAAWQEAADSEAAHGASPSDLPLAAPIHPVASCTPSYSTCEACGSGKTRKRTVTTTYQIIWNNGVAWENCVYNTTYGTCGSCAV